MAAHRKIELRQIVDLTWITNIIVIGVAKEFDCKAINVEGQELGQPELVGKSPRDIDAERNDAKRSGLAYFQAGRRCGYIQRWQGRLDGCQSGDHVRVRIKAQPSGGHLDRT